MKFAHRLSIYLLALFAVFGMIRGLRMILEIPDGNIPFLFPFFDVKDSLFSNYIVLGWVILTLVGVLGSITFWFTLKQKKGYPYLVLVEGIFCSSLISAHGIYGGFHLIHFFMLIPSIFLIVVGVLRAPREF